MRSFAGLTLTLLTLAAAPAASNAALWTITPSNEEGIGPVVVTPKGTVVSYTWAGLTGHLDTGLTRRVVRARMASAVPYLATYGADGFALAAYLELANRAEVVLGRAGDTSAVTRQTLGGRGDIPRQIAGNRRGDIAVLTTNSTASRPKLWLRPANAKAFRRTLLPIRGAVQKRPVLALGRRGELLVVWQHGGGAGRQMFARFRDTRGRWGARQKVSRGPIAFQAAAIDHAGRAVVAWHEREETKLAVARPGAPFGRPIVIARTREVVRTLGSRIAGGGTYGRWLSMASSPSGRVLLAWDESAGDHPFVRVAEIRSGRLGEPRDLSSPDQNLLVHDTAIADDGAAVVVGTRGKSRLLAAYRPAGAPFAQLEPISRDDERVWYSTGTAIDPRRGTPVLRYALKTPDSHLLTTHFATAVP